MRLAVPLDQSITNDLFDNPTSVSYLKGWGNLLSEEGNQTTIPTKDLPRCPMCQEKGIRLPLGVQGTMVGKAAIKESNQLRSLHIQDPWTLEAAKEVGPLAPGEWLEEQNSPPLDCFPKVSKETLELIQTLVEKAPSPPKEFDGHEWGILSKMGDEVIASEGSLRDAAHCYITEWRKTRNPTTMTPTGMNVFKHHVDQALFQKGLDIATRGVSAHSHSPPIRSPQGPYPSVRDNPIQSLKDLWRDLVEGRLFLFTTRSEGKVGPLMETKLPFVEQESMGVPKIRYINDPRLEINSRANSRRRPFLFVPTIPSLLRRVLYWRRRYHGVPIWLCKRDVKSAFKLVITQE